MRTVLAFFAIAGLTGMPNGFASQHEVSAEGSSGQIVSLSNAAIRVEIEQRGGQIVDVRLAGSDINPLSWRKTPETMPKTAHGNALFKGHFLCMGRTGNPTQGELSAGVPMRGEQTGRIWDITKQTSQCIEMECAAPLDGLIVKRRVEMDGTSAVLRVTERFENTGSLGRLNNILQHATVGPPFLSKATLINSNAKQGFNHKFSNADSHGLEYAFPIALVDKEGKTTDLRLSSDPISYLSKHIFQSGDPYGWITAYDPVSGLVIGYLWKTGDYPWINIWQQVQDGIPVAKGLEFGTAGMSGTYEELIEPDAWFHEVPSWEFIDAGERVEKNYLMFLFNIGPNRENPHLVIERDRFLLNGEFAIANPFGTEK